MVHSLRLDEDDPMAQLPELAERLGVKQYNKLLEGPTILLTTKSGKSYDVFKLVSAVLDRIDKLTTLQ